MKTMQVHGGLAVGIPEGFHVMDAEELWTFFPDGIAERWAIRDEERHAVFSIVWHDAPSRLLAKLVGTRSLAERAEKIAAKELGPFGYRLEGRSTRELCGTEAAGFSYAFSVQGTPQSAETIVLRNGPTCYTLYWYARSADACRMRPVLEEILGSLVWVDR